MFSLEGESEFTVGQLPCSNGGVGTATVSELYGWFSLSFTDRSEVFSAIADSTTKIALNSGRRKSHRSVGAARRAMPHRH